MVKLRTSDIVSVDQQQRQHRSVNNKQNDGGFTFPSHGTSPPPSARATCPIPPPVQLLLSVTLDQWNPDQGEALSSRPTAPNIFKR